MSNPSPNTANALQAACDWLTGLLTSEPVLVKQIQAQAKTAGHAWRTCQRAKQVLHIKAAKSGKSWVWHLPELRQQQTQQAEQVQPSTTDPAPSPPPSPVTASPPACLVLWQLAMVRNDYASPSASIAIAVPLWAVMGRR